MNIFVLDLDPKRCAEYHCDKHVLKMLIEYTQLLSSAVRIKNKADVGYNITHRNHPCNAWVRKSLSNWKWLKQVTIHLNNEYKHRYSKQVNHKSFDIMMTLPEPEIPDYGLTDFVLAMPDLYKLHNTPVDAYREYYKGEKSRFATWKTKIPVWYKIEEKIA